MSATETRPLPALLTGFLLTGTLGSVHAFSVIVVPLETVHAASRADVSLVYSLALICLTFAVLGSHVVFRRVAPAWLVAGVGLASAAGLGLAAQGGGLSSVFLGYSVLFGFANGLGYALALQLAAHAYPARKGTAMGAVTAVYACGAMVFANVFDRIAASAGVFVVFEALGLVMIAVALVGAAACGVSRVEIAPRGVAPAAAGPGAASGELLGLLWLGYGLGCLAGLMAIGHAAGIVQAAGGVGSVMALGVTLIAVGNALGGFAAGALADRFSLRRLLASLPLVSAAALVGLAAAGRPTAAILCLAVIGFCYGAIIALYPVATTRYVGLGESARAYGRVFTAWGLAGLLGPWIAGLLFDLGGGYGPAALTASAAAVLSAGAALLLPEPTA